MNTDNFTVYDHKSWCAKMKWILFLNYRTKKVKTDTDSTMRISVPKRCESENLSNTKTNSCTRAAGNSESCIKYCGVHETELQVLEG